MSNNASNQHETDEDATLNEIGKFDESYTFEKDHEFLRWDKKNNLLTFKSKKFEESFNDRSSSFANDGPKIIFIIIV